MKKLRFLFGVLAISSALMFITNANASSGATVFPDCDYYPYGSCIVRWDPVDGPIYVIDYNPREQ